MDLSVHTFPGTQVTTVSYLTQEARDAEERASQSPLRAYLQF